MTAEGRLVRCSVCGRESRMSAAEEAAANVEAETLFGVPVPDEEQEILCHPCYIRFVKWFDALSPADHVAIAAGTYPREKLFPRAGKPWIS